MHNQHHCLLILSYDVNGELPVKKANVLEFCVLLALNFDVNLPWQGVASYPGTLGLGNRLHRQHVIKQANSSRMHDCVFAGLTERSGSSRDSFDVRVPKVVRVSALYLSTVAVTSSTNPSKYTPLGCKDSAQQGLSTAIAMFPREREHVLTLQLDERFAACVEEGLRLHAHA